MSIRDELLAIQASNNEGLLHAREVVEWARRHTKSALHAAIEWDDKTAADEFRLWQVRRLVHLHIVTEGGAPMMVSLSIDRTKGGGYRNTDDVARVPNLRDVMLADALAELDRVQGKYARVTELAQVWAEADKVRATRRRKAA
jgi:hypothetical protein